MNSIKTEGIVIRRSNFDETDRILTLYTKDLGKIRVLAKGIKKIKSKLAGSLEPFTNCSLILHPGKTFYTITSATIINSNYELGHVCQNFTSAHYFAELIDKFTEDGEKNLTLFEIFSQAISRICGGRNHFLQAYFELKILDNLGYSPQLNTCVKCHNRLKTAENYFNFNDGGVACLNCRSLDSVKISDDAIKAMRLIVKSDLALVDKLKISSKLVEEVEKILDRYQKEVIEREIKSKVILKSLKV